MKNRIAPKNTKNLIYFLVLLSFFWTIQIFSEAKTRKTLYVYKILLKNVKDTNLEQRFRSRLTEYYLRNFPDYAIMDDDSIWALKQKVEKQRALGCNEEVCIQEISRAINADEVITGEIEETKDRYAYSFKNTKKLDEKSKSLEIKSVVQGEMFTYQMEYYTNEIGKALMDPRYKINKKDAPLAEDEIGEIKITTLKSLSEIKLPEVKRENIDLIKRLKEFNLGGADTLAKEKKYDKALDRIRDGLDGIDSLSPEDKKASTGLREEFVKRLYYIGDKLFEDRFKELEKAYSEEKNWTPEREGFFSRLFIGKKFAFDLRFVEGSRGIEGWEDLKKEYYKKIEAKERNPETVKKIEGYLREYTTRKYAILIQKPERIGDEFFAKESYLEAIQSYNKALAILKDYTYDTALQKRIEEKKQNSGKKYYVPLVANLESEGDAYNKSGQFQEAFEKYSSALTTFAEGRDFLEAKNEARVNAKKIEAQIQSLYDRAISRYETSWKSGEYQQASDTLSIAKSELEILLQNSGTRKDLVDKIKQLSEGVPKKLEAEKQILTQKEAKFREAMQYGGDYSKEVNEIQTKRGRIKTILAEIKEKEICSRARGKLEGGYCLQQNSIGMTLNLIPSGEFLMGCSPSDSECEGDEKPRHKVKITKPFFLGTTEVTQGQWRAVMGKNPSDFKDCGDTCPVESVSWLDTQEFIKKLCQKEGMNPCKYRLPTEAEWEYSARGYTSLVGEPSRTTPTGNSVYYWGNRMDGDYAWYDGNSGSRTHPVGQKKPNAWGLYDMSGNVWEWVGDWYDSGYYGRSPESDPQGARDGSFRVLRGGSWGYDVRSCRSSIRFHDTPDLRSRNLGFRLAWTP